MEGFNKYKAISCCANRGYFDTIYLMAEMIGFESKNNDVSKERTTTTTIGGDDAALDWSKGEERQLVRRYNDHCLRTKKNAVLTGIFIKDRPRYHAFIDPRFLRPSVGSFEYVSVIAEGRLRHTSNLANMFEAAML